MKEIIIHKLDFIKVYETKYQENLKTGHRLGGNICKIHIWKGLLSNTYRKLLKLSNKKTNNLFKNLPESLNTYFPKDRHMSNKHMKRCSKLIKTTMTYHYMCIRMAKI